MDRQQGKEYVYKDRFDRVSNRAAVELRWLVTVVVLKLTYLGTEICAPPYISAHTHQH